MRKIFIIGNLCRDPELRTTQSGVSVCTFSVAVNRRRSAEAGRPEADFFRVTTWRQTAEHCAKYLAKGRKVSVVGDISLNQYKDSNGLPRYSMEVTADEVEFLSPRSDADDTGLKYDPTAFTSIKDDSDLPF